MLEIVNASHDSLAYFSLENGTCVLYYLLQAKIELLESVRTLERLGFNLFASYGTADYYSEHGVKVQPIEWPYSDGNGNGSRSQASPPLPRSHSTSTSIAAALSIGDYLTQRKIDLVINLPLRQNR